ncbi:SDR family NAD(P)-dependent oxidoreductase [Actinomyces sp. 2119]|uniref:SDR family NAD(P)-dependent oxidoreductase n=1 Tax=Actinomyces lilanjuaniae TaxID=2321394 RepID=A0ABN5PPW4_9ACTO|nr:MULTISPECIES: SDR family NAD(P)-dependent oxidoreductase [Actinomyces]AYD89074.1 SDR family NAD(P)-dependent oxidoreductase [Actinomyces lilanjuaniae]RJF40481.1 SDR family NAD(P)-dependent oxidoreductase [Actinomyces sp. 2119]RJF41858.1 SDR family NAD(P)-dependent oxidoreductase [Actinomyces sp. 2119]
MGTALVTGATSGLGLEFAWQLAQAHHDLVLIARDEQRLRHLADELHQIAGVGAQVLAADLAVPEDCARVATRLRQGGQSAPSGPGDASAPHTAEQVASRPVDLLVNNAGFGLGQSFVGGDLAREERALDVMVRAVLVLSHAAAEAMAARGHGAILNVSSMTARTAMGTYAAHKAWVLSFTEGLASELEGTGVTATALCPGLVRTGFHAAAGVDESTWRGPVWLDAERVAAEGLAAVRRGQVICTPSLRYRSASALLRTAPRWFVRRVAGTSRSASAGAAPPTQPAE